jgi:hypothetical protein
MTKRSAKNSIHLVGQVLDRYEVDSDQAKALLRDVTDYAKEPMLI